MEHKKIHNKGQAQLFKNQYLEYLTKTHPFVIWGMYIPIISYLVYYGITQNEITIIQTICVFLFGMFFWTFTEYMLHRFVFHSSPKSKRGKRLAYIMHGNHHEYPRDKERLFMPAVPSLLIASVFFLLFYLFAGKFVFVFFPGFILGYLMYGTMHYAIHAWNPPFKWTKGLWRNHQLHHYKYENLGFGVSTTLWDWVFGTLFDKNVKDDKEKIKELMY